MATTLTNVGYSSTSPTNTLYDLELAKTDLMNHFMTRRGERVMAPQFGSVIWDFLFDQLTPDVISIIQDDAVTILRTDPRFEVNSVNVTEVEHGIYLEIDAYYIPQNVNTTLAVTFDNNAAQGTTL